MECQGLIQGVITTRPEYGSRSKRHRDFRDKNPDKAAQPDDALSAWHLKKTLVLDSHECLFIIS